MANHSTVKFQISTVWKMDLFFFLRDDTKNRVRRIWEWKNLHWRINVMNLAVRKEEGRQQTEEIVNWIISRLRISVLMLFNIDTCLHIPHFMFAWNEKCIIFGMATQGNVYQTQDLNSKDDHFQRACYHLWGYLLALLVVLFICHSNE